MAWIDILTDNMTGAWTGPTMADGYLAMANGARLRNSYGSGASQVKVPSFAAMQAAMTGHNAYFVNNFSASVNWLLVYAGAGHTSTNACVEARRAFCQVLDANDVWQWAFVGLPLWGKRVLAADDDSGVVPATQTKLPGGILRFQPGPAIARPGESSPGARGYELWPSDWDGSNPAVSFYGAVNRSLFTQMKAICFGAQVRLALWNEDGVDDRAASRFVTQIGNDPHALPDVGMRYITDAGVETNVFGGGYPYTVWDANSSRWRYVTNDWTWVTCVTADDLWGHEADTPPPWSSNWTPKWPYNKSPTYAITTAELQANVPPAPPGETDPDPGGGGSETPVPTRGSWFAKTSNGDNAWNSRAASSTPSSKIRRRRGVKLWS